MKTGRASNENENGKGEIRHLGKMLSEQHENSKEPTVKELKQPVNNTWNGVTPRQN